MDWGVEESALLGWRVGVDSEALAVDHDVVVEPTHRRQILRIRTAAINPTDDVMNLQPVSARTTRNRARRTITIQHKPA